MPNEDWIPDDDVATSRANYNRDHPELTAAAAADSVNLALVGEIGGLNPYSSAKCYACSWGIAHTWADHDRYIGAA